MSDLHALKSCQKIINGKKCGGHMKQRTVFWECSQCGESEFMSEELMQQKIIEGKETKRPGIRPRSLYSVEGRDIFQTAAGKSPA